MTVTGAIGGSPARCPGRWQPGRAISHVRLTVYRQVALIHPVIAFDDRNSYEAH